MSRHIFHSRQGGKSIEVALGCNPPSDSCFLTVGEDGETVYSVFEEADAFNKPLSYFRSILDELQVKVPESMSIEVEIDKRTKNGQRMMLHQPDGTIAPA